MSRRQSVHFSASPRNADAVLVLTELAKLPARQRSSAMWAWAAAYLRGETGSPIIPTDDDGDDDMFAALFDDL